MVLKICFLANARSIHTRRWVDWFKAKGFDVFVVTSEVNEGWAVRQIKLRGGIPVPSANADSAFKYAVSPWAIHQVKQVLREEKPDVLHAFYVSNYGFLGAQTGFHPYIVTAWGSDILLNPKQYWLLKRMVCKALRSADHITTDSSKVLAEMVRLGAEADIHLISCGVNTNKFSPDNRSADSGDVDARIVISLRSLEPMYDVRTLVKAASIVLQSAPTTRFIIAGGGSECDDLANLAVTYGVYNSFKFLGELTQDEVARYLASADIYVSTALSDAGLSCSTAEAMACGLPVVVSDVGDNREWITDNVDGFLFPAGNAEALSDRILDLVRNNFARLRMGGEGRELVVNRLNVDEAMGKMRQIYQTMVLRYE